METAQQAYTVTAITRRIKEALENSLQGVWVEGEVSNYLHHGSGHRYLSLKDERATIKLTIWKSVGSYLKFEPQNGQKILAYGDVTVYEKGGSYQLNVRKLVPVGIGELELAFRQLHEKLQAEGLFADERKVEMPLFPQKIGVVTSPTGAAIRDIIQIARRRNNSVELIVYPAKVQGDGAEKTIAAGIEYFNGRDDIDIIITGRGGGSLEDLWPFNTEVTVRAIAASQIPVISAVGHEIDTTLADMVADLRAPTPSAAAELAVWSKTEMAERLTYFSERQASLLDRLVKQARSELSALVSRPVFARPLDLIAQRQQFLDTLTRTLGTAGKNSFEKHRNRLSLVLARLETLSPLKILARGYSVTRKSPSGKLIRSVKDILPGDRMETVLADGRVKSFVEEIRTDKKQ